MPRHSLKILKEHRRCYGITCVSFKSTEKMGNNKNSSQATQYGAPLAPCLNDEEHRWCVVGLKFQLVRENQLQFFGKTLDLKPTSSNEGSKFGIWYKQITLFINITLVCHFTLSVNANRIQLFDRYVTCILYFGVTVFSKQWHMFNTFHLIHHRKSDMNGIQMDFPDIFYAFQWLTTWFNIMFIWKTSGMPLCCSTEAHDPSAFSHCAPGPANSDRRVEEM